MLRNINGEAPLSVTAKDTIAIVSGSLHDALCPDPISIEKIFFNF